jgi:hypothetical protein
MVSLYVPQSDDLFEIELSYITYERIVLTELMRFADDALVTAFGQNGSWELLRRDDHAELAKKFFTPFDPLFYLGSYIEIETSPLRTLLPYNAHLRGIAKSVRLNRNLWAHYRPPETRAEVIGAITNLRAFCSGVEMVDAEGAGLAISERLSEIAATRARLIAGKVGAPAPEDSTEPVVKPVTEELRTENAPIPSRPCIGGIWEHALPELVLTLNPKYRDVLDSAGNSMSNQLGADVARTVRRWLTMSINSWLYVDKRDGATVALIDGDPHLIGYLGDEPALDENEYRGFFLPGAFENLDGVLTESSSRLAVSNQNFDLTLLTQTWVNRNIPSEASVRVTDYGDVVLIDEAGPRRIATLEEKI